MVLLTGMMTTPASASQVRLYEINTLEQLKDELKNYSQESCVNIEDQMELIEKSSPEVIEAFIEEKTEEALTAMNAIDPDSLLKQDEDGTFRGTTSIDLGDGCTAIVEFEDGVDEPLLVSGAKMSGSAVSRAVNGETIWNDYGNRYFTASTTILSGVGGCKISLENHYTLSENGIDERYGDAYENGGFNIGITGTVGHGDVIISDASARTPGASDVNMYVRFNWQYEGQGIATVQGNTKLSTSVGFVAINKTKKQIQVKHSWTVN